MTIRSRPPIGAREFKKNSLLLCLVSYVLFFLRQFIWFILVSLYYIFLLLSTRTTSTTSFIVRFLPAVVPYQYVDDSFGRRRQQQQRRQRVRRCRQHPPSKPKAGRIGRFAGAASRIGTRTVVNCCSNSTDGN